MQLVRLFLLVSLLTAKASSTFSQFFAGGVVLDANSGMALSGASVYINNSTRGTVTDAAGTFALGPLQPGNYEVVVSYVGYEPLLYNLVITQTMRLEFRLTPARKQLQDVLILTDETRRRYLDIFRKNLLGFTSEAQRCRIRNLDKVQFAAGTGNKDLQAFCSQELIIENLSLGYTIYFQLTDFYFNPDNNYCFFYGYTRFVDRLNTRKPQQRWLNRRRQVYMGSSQHFFRSLVNKIYEAEGFTVQELQTVSRPRKEALAAMQNSERVPQAQNLKLDDTIKMKLAFPVHADSLLLAQNETGFTIYNLRIPDLRVLYKDRTLLHSEVVAQRFLLRQPKAGTENGLQKKQDPVQMDAKGRLLTPANLLYDGIWAFERLAYMLPDDYEPPASKR
ncbi:MAG TPA: carboxypeptidase-like regulatory domain-containing protein [Lacibacter sp.]|nr:carboxypeptidase-like regulatory domain-containing protein [Lacibacter sp.]HMO87540.1 carboxypeptidase-like regulatory domain-containing protein [Lacibacter sp.]HMP87381.1 carboxypeptidase-like regulatory domain-containing protein [Lacibacter sp.]